MLAGCAVVGCGGGGDGGENWSSRVVDAGHDVKAQRLVAASSAADVVAVRSDGCTGRTRASGFVVGGLVVTNAHVVDGAEEIVVAGPRFSASLQVSRRVAGLDLAVAAAGVSSGLVWAHTDAPPGTPVVLAGRGPRGFQWLPARVQLYSEPGGFGGDGVAMLLDGPTTPGFSGGAVINLDGEVVGVLRAVDLSTGLAVAVPVSDYQSWLIDDKYGDSSTSCLP